MLENHIVTIHNNFDGQIFILNLDNKNNILTRVRLVNKSFLMKEETYDRQTIIENAIKSKYGFNSCFISYDDVNALSCFISKISICNTIILNYFEDETIMIKLLTFNDLGYELHINDYEKITKFMNFFCSVLISAKNVREVIPFFHIWDNSTKGERKIIRKKVYEHFRNDIRFHEYRWISKKYQNLKKKIGVVNTFNDYLKISFLYTCSLQLLEPPKNKFARYPCDVKFKFSS